MNIMAPLLIKIYDTKYGLMGYLAMDSFINNVSMGGIRVKVEDEMADELYSREAMCLAREMSLKFGFHSIPMGGAKGVVRLPSGLSQKERDDYFSALGKNLAPFLRKGIVRTGQDMGMTERDLYFVMRASGKESKIIPEANAKSDSGKFTALGIVTTLEVVLEYCNIRNNPLTCCIEGFGSVGLHLAQFLAEKGIKIRGISTRFGALFNPEGLDVDKLLKSQNEYRDELVKHYNEAQKIEREELLRQEADILFPCAGLFSINRDNAVSIKAKIIISGANCAADEDCVDILHQKGIIYIPGFVANAGSVLKSYVMKEELIVNREPIQKKVIELFLERVKSLIKEAQSNKISLFQQAQIIAKRNIEKLQHHKDTFQKKIKRKLINISRRLM